MEFHKFHDGYFDGIRLESDTSAQIFLRTVEGTRYILDLKGIERLTLSEVWEGNIIFDLVIRSSSEATSADVRTLYHCGDNSAEDTKLLESARGKGLQILEMGASYGANGLFLFQSFEFKEVIDRTTLLLRPIDAESLM